MKWRKWNNILHRDIGYAVAVLTVIYGISGVAVNHMADWNPNYSFEKRHTTVDPIRARAPETMLTEALGKLGLTEQPSATHRPEPDTLQLFYEGETWSIDLPTGNVLIEQTLPRPVLREMNDLHLNAFKGAWTFVADLYAVALIIVAITGLFVLKGKKGITGRGAWLTTLGALVPLGFLVYYKIAH